MSTYRSVLIHRNSVIMFFGCLYPCSLHWTSSVCDTVQSCVMWSLPMSSGLGLLCDLMMLWITQSATEIYAWMSMEYSGGRSRIRKRRFMTPKMRSIMFRADTWHKLNSSSLFAGLDNNNKYRNDMMWMKIPQWRLAPFSQVIASTTIWYKRSYHTSS